LGEQDSTSQALTFLKLASIIPTWYSGVVNRVKMHSKEDKVRKKREKNSKASKGREKKTIVRGLLKGERQPCRGSDARDSTEAIRDKLNQSRLVTIFRE